MGQKVNPIGFRIGINRTWDSCWFSSKHYASWVHEDLKIQALVKQFLANAGVAKVMIERFADRVRVIIHTSRPGVVIGSKGAGLDALKKKITQLCKKEISINIAEVKKPEMDATLVAESIAQQLERRVSFRRAMKKSVQSALRFGAQGIRINCSGRLGGAEIARMEWYREGRVPLHTLRADIDYGIARANTTYGVIGVKVWIYKGDVVDGESKETTAV